VDKALVGKKPQTTVAATAASYGAFARHVATLQEIIAGEAGLASAVIPGRALLGASPESIPPPTLPLNGFRVRAAPASE
jgi:hypothetical protein